MSAKLLCKFEKQNKNMQKDVMNWEKFTERFSYMDCGRS